MDTQTVRYQHLVLLRGGQMSGGVFFYPLFKPLEFSFNFMCTPALRQSINEELQQVNRLCLVNLLICWVR